MCHLVRKRVVRETACYVHRRAVLSFEASHFSYRLQPTGHYMYRQFDTHNSTFCPHSCIYVFCVDLGTNSHYFPIQH